MTSMVVGFRDVIEFLINTLIGLRSMSVAHYFGMSCIFVRFWNVNSCFEPLYTQINARNAS